jgi:dTDP-glucose 4,6-dehydratase
MRHVITGGSGFTGSVLCRTLLEKEEKVVVFDLKRPTSSFLPSIHYIRGDVTNRNDPEALSLKPGDVVYHLAARQFADAVPSRRREEWFAAVNVVGTDNVVDALQCGGARGLVFFSSDMTYGKPLACPVPTDHPLNPLGPYGRSKVAAERIIRSVSTIKATIFRPRLITGPGRLGILGRLFRLIRAGLPVPLIGRERTDTR